MNRVAPFRPSASTAAGGDDREARFVASFAAASGDVFACVLMIIPDRHAAEDVVQDVCSVLWRKFDDFEPGTSFSRWACAVAFREAKAHARRRRRSATVPLDEAAMNRVETVRANAGELLELRREMLGTCLERLPARDRSMLERFYRDGATAKEIADAVGRSADGVYVTLGRLRRRLFDCVQRRLAGETQ